MVLLHRDGVEAVGVQRLTVERQLTEGLGAAGPDDVHAMRELVELRVLADEGILPEDMPDHALELRTGHLQHEDCVVIRQTLDEVAVVYHWTEHLASDRTGAHQHEVDREAVAQDIRDEVTERGLLIALRMRQLMCETGDDAIVLLRSDIPVVSDKVLHLTVTRAVAVVDRDDLPGEAVDGVPVGIHHDVEASDLIRARTGLYDVDVIDLRRRLRKCMAVAADDNVHAPVRVQHLGELFILLEADMREEHGEVDIDGIVRVTDVADLMRGFRDIDEGADQLVTLRGSEDLLGDDTDEKNLHAVELRDPVWPEHAATVRLDVEICVDDREVGALFEEKEMRETVVDLMVSDGCDIWSDQVHDADRGGALILRIDDTATEHIARDGIDHIPLLPADLVDIAGEQ